VLLEKVTHNPWSRPCTNNQQHRHIEMLDNQQADPGNVPTGTVLLLLARRKDEGS